MPKPARVLVQGAGLIVRSANREALEVCGRPLHGIPLTESVPEYEDALTVIRAAAVDGVAGSVIIRAPNGELGRVIADPTGGGACVTFVPTGAALQRIATRDLILGNANDVWKALSDREYLHLAAREAYPEPEFEEAQDVMAWVLETGAAAAVWISGGRLTIARTAPGLLVTHYRVPIPGLPRGLPLAGPGRQVEPLREPEVELPVGGARPG